MKLKTKILLSMMFLASVSMFVPSAGAVRGNGKSAAPAASASAARVPARRPTTNRGRSAANKRGLTGLEAGSYIDSLVKFSDQEKLDLARHNTTIWHILVAKGKWRAIQCLLGADVHKKLDKEVVAAFRESFVACLRAEDRVYSMTPFALAEISNAEMKLKSCIPYNLPDYLKRQLPPAFNTFVR